MCIAGRAEADGLDGNYRRVRVTETTAHHFFCGPTDYIEAISTTRRLGDARVKIRRHAVP